MTLHNWSAVARWPPLTIVRIQFSAAAQAIAAGKCKVALITLAGRPRHGGRRPGAGMAPGGGGGLTDGPPEAGFENIYKGTATIGDSLDLGENQMMAQMAMRPAASR